MFRIGPALAGICMVLAALTVPAGATEALPFELKGEWQQGSVIFGKAPPGTRVWFKDQALQVTAQGAFVLGLDRDESPEASLRVQLPGEAKPSTYRHSVAKREYRIQRIDGLPPSMVTPPKEVLERIQKEQRMVAAARKRMSDREDFLQDFVWPCLGRISGVFGSQRILNGTPKQPHYGVDVAVGTGTPVRAPAGGIVSLAHPDMYYTGGTLMIDHGYGLSSAFLHLSKLLVKEGEEVRQGQVVAHSGATGRATGPHLDWRVNWFDARVDAELLVPPMPQKEQGSQ